MVWESASGVFPKTCDRLSNGNLGARHPMISIRYAGWASLASLALIVGCGGEEATPPAIPNVAPKVDTPATTPAEKSDMKSEMKSDMKSEMKKDEAPKADAGKMETPKADTKKTDAPKVEGPKVDAPKVDASKLSADEMAEIKKLPAAEQAAAIAQFSCPVGGPEDHLGSMGMPVKVTAEGKTFYICCDNCKKALDADPKKYVAKLAK